MRNRPIRMSASTSTTRLKERQYGNAFLSLNQVGTLQREVVTPVGNIDFIWHHPARGTGIVELKHYKSIKHAIGQVLAYRPFVPNCSFLEIVYFEYCVAKNVSLPKADASYASLSRNNNIPLMFSNVLQYVPLNYLLELSATSYTPCEEEQISEANITYTMISTTPILSMEDPNQRHMQW